jgi:hypothetical protein
VPAQSRSPAPGAIGTVLLGKELRRDALFHARWSSFRVPPRGWELDSDGCGWQQPGPGPGMELCHEGTLGEIAEVIAVKGTVTDTDVAKIEGYLKKKFNL